MKVVFTECAGCGELINEDKMVECGCCQRLFCEACCGNDADGFEIFGDLCSSCHDVVNDENLY